MMIIPVISHSYLSGRSRFVYTNDISPSYTRLKTLNKSHIDIWTGTFTYCIFAGLLKQAPFWETPQLPLFTYWVINHHLKSCFTLLQNHYYNSYTWISCLRIVAADTFQPFLCERQLWTAAHGFRLYSSCDSDRYTVGMLTPTNCVSIFYSVNNSPLFLLSFLLPQPGVSSTKTGHVRVLLFQIVIIKNACFGRILPLMLCDSELQQHLVTHSIFIFFYWKLKKFHSQHPSHEAPGQADPGALLSVDDPTQSR